MSNDPIRLRLPLEQHHQFQAQTNDCAPFTTAMVINTLTGTDLLGAQLALEMNRPRLRLSLVPIIVRRIPNWATFPWGVADELRQRGVKARWRLFAAESDLHRALGDNRIAMPIIGEPWRWQDGRPQPWAHIKPLAAFDPVQGWGFVDPAARQPFAWQPAEEFARLWRNMWNILVETL
jgi:hypothetical protein